MRRQSSTFTASKWFRAYCGGLLLLLLLGWSGAATAQLRVSGKRLLDPCGEQVIIRGVEQDALGQSSGPTIQEIAKTGANAMRMLPMFTSDPGNLTAASFDNLLAVCKNNGMIAIITPRISWAPAENELAWQWYERDDIYAVLMKYKDHTILDGVMEQDYDDQDLWEATSKTAINRLRAKGYTQPINCMSAGYGRSTSCIINKAAAVFNHDPLKNTMFNVQSYWTNCQENWCSTKGTSTEIIKQNLAALANLNYVVNIGTTPWAEGASCNGGFVDYQTAMTECQRLGLGYLNWDWYNPNEWSHVYAMTYNNQYGGWVNLCTKNNNTNDCRSNTPYGCEYGYNVAIGNAASIQKTSVKTNFYRTASCSSTVTLRTPENPASTVNGLEYRYYEGTWSVLPNFDALTAVKTGNVANFDMSVRNRNDNYGFRYTGYVNVPTDGTYTFYTSSDDGSKLYIGTTQVVNNDGLHAAQERSGAIGLKAGKHAITVTFFEATGGEVLSVSYAGPGITKQVIPNAALFRAGTATVGTGLRGEYFNNRTLTAPSVLVRTDATVNFQWWDPAGPGVTNDNFSVRWTGQVEAPVSGSYTFTTVSDDGVRLWVNGVQVVNNWTDHAETTNNGTPISLTGGQKYNLTMEFYDATSGATARLLWAYPGQTQVVVPQNRLFPAGSGARAATVSAVEAQGLSVFPNPANDGYLNVEYVAAETGRATVVLADGMGRQALQGVYPVEKGQNTLRLSTATVRPGFYLLRVRQGSRKATTKVVVGR